MPLKLRMFLMEVTRHCIPIYEEGVTVTFKLNDQSDLSNQNIKMKGNGIFAVTWWIEWFGYV